jgi:hypothetical protein
LADRRRLPAGDASLKPTGSEDNAAIANRGVARIAGSFDGFAVERAAFAERGSASGAAVFSVASWALNWPAAWKRPALG